MCKSHPYGCPWISRCSANSFPSEKYPITSHECSERWPSSCWWVTAEQNFHFIHQSSTFHCATASIKTTDLKTCSDGLNKSNQDLNESWISSAPPPPVFPVLNILSPDCFCLSFLFAAFDLMSPHSVGVLMENKCKDETTLSCPTCLAGSLIVLSIQVWKTWLGGRGGLAQL